MAQHEVADLGGDALGAFDQDSVFKAVEDDQFGIGHRLIAGAGTDSMDDRQPSRFEEPHPLRMVPTFVWRGEVAAQVREPLNAGIVGALDAMRRGAPGAAWQSDQALHEHDAFGEPVACIDEAAAAALAYSKIGHAGFAIPACRANVNAPGADTVNFHDPRPQTAIVRPPVTEPTADNTDRVVVRVSAGTLLVFPAWPRHSVDAKRGGEARISVSFNVMLASDAEPISKPLWQSDRA